MIVAIVTLLQSCLQMLSKFSNAQPHQAGKVLVAHARSLLVRARIEHNLFVLRQRLINQGVERKQIAKRWLGTDLTTRKEVAEFALLLKLGNGQEERTTPPPGSRPLFEECLFRPWCAPSSGHGSQPL